MLHPNHRNPPSITHSCRQAHLEVTISMEGRTISPSGTKPWGQGIHPWAHPKLLKQMWATKFFFPKSMGFFSVFSWKKWVYSISNRIVTTPFSIMILGEGVKKISLFGTQDWRKGVSFSLKLHSLKRQKPVRPLKKNRPTKHPKGKDDSLPTRIFPWAFGGLLVFQEGQNL